QRLRRRPARDSRATPRDGCALGAPPLRTRADRRPCRRPSRRDLGSASAAEGRRRVLDPRRPGREARPVRSEAGYPGDGEAGGPGARRCRDAEGVSVPGIVADVGERGDIALQEWAERLGDGPPERVTPKGEVDAKTVRALRALVAAVEAVHAVQRPADTTV